MSSSYDPRMTTGDLRETFADDVAREAYLQTLLAWRSETNEAKSARRVSQQRVSAKQTHMSAGQLRRARELLGWLTLAAQGDLQAWGKITFQMNQGCRTHEELLRMTRRDLWRLSRELDRLRDENERLESRENQPENIGGTTS